LRLWIFLLGVGLAPLGTGGDARADDRAGAQLLFDQGKQLMAEGKTADACPKFEASAQLSHTPGVRLNLVDCWTAIGRTASAWAMAAEALDLAERSGDKEAADAARQRHDALLKQLTYLSVTIAPDAMVPGLEVTRDGQALLQGAWGTPVPVDPGSHVVAARAPGRQPWTVTRELTQPGVTVTIEVPVLAEQTSSTPEAPPQEPPKQRPFRKLAVASAALGLVGIGVGAALGIDAMSKKTDYQAHETPDGQCADPTCQTASHDAFTAGTWSTVSFIAGAAFLGAGAFLWFYAPGDSATVAPVAGPQTAGLSVAGRW